jgi:acyl carrier protein
MAEFQQQICRIAHQIRPDIQELMSGDAVFTEVGFTSFDLVQLVLRLEQEFDISLIDRQTTASSMLSLSAIGKLVHNRLHED